MSVGKIQEFDVDNGNWTLYCERVDLYFKANGIKEELRLPTLISLAGDRAYELMVNLASPKKPGDITYSELVKLVQGHLQPRPSIMAERYRFRQRRQGKAESVTQYIAALKQLSRYCDFGNALSENLRDQLVCGLASDLIRQRLFAEDGLTFVKAINLASTLEAAERDAASVEMAPTEGWRKNSTSNAQASEINAMTTGAQRNVTSQPRRPCGVCGGQGHEGNKCRYRDFVCNICKRRGHLKRVCPNAGNTAGVGAKWRDTRAKGSKGQQQRRGNFFAEVKEGQQSESDEDHSEPIYQMSLSEYKSVSLVLSVDDKPLRMEVDTGTPASCISKSTYEALFSHLPVQKIKTAFKSYTGDNINPLGIVTPIVKYKDKVKRLDLYVVDNGLTTLIGRQWLAHLNIQLPKFRLEQGQNYVCGNVTVDDHVKVNSTDKLTELLYRYSEVFEEGLGRYTGGEAALRVRPDAVPVFCRARPVPYALRQQVDAELDAMLREGIIEPVECSDWATPLVPVHKKDGGLRVCADFKVTLNPCLLVDRYPLPRVQDMFADLAGGVTYTKIDLSQAYAQICLTEDSKPYTVINTHRGLFRYNRLVYGLSSSSGIFQRIITNLIKDIPNTQAFLDDVIITGDQTTHLRNVEAVLARLKQYGLKVRKNKCVFFADEIKYLGYVVNKNGIQPDPSKIESIKKMPVPANVSDLRSFLGMVNFYAKFVRNISDYLFPLYELLRKGRQWHWTAECSAAFREVKELLAGSNVLAHYDPKQSLVLTCDASSRGVGGVLSQVNKAGVERAVAYVSRKLTGAERAYSQIHREALAIVYCVKKYHQYLYGRHFMLRTDHKPLVSIFGPQNGIPCMAASRMQRWAIILSAYDFDIQYVRSEVNGADALSRLPIDNPAKEKIELADQSYLHFASTALLLDCEEIRKQTRHDPVLSRVLSYIDNGWPQSLDIDNIRPYWNRRSELYTELGCIMWGHRVVMPSRCRGRVLEELHEPHMGMVKTKSMARSYVWWPGVDEDIETRCKACAICAENAASPPRSPPSPWRWPHRPYERVHIDFLGPMDGHMYLVTVDARSKWIEVFKMQRTTADCVIRRLRESWSRFGLPRQVASDNGPPFSSQEFNDFLASNGIKHVYSPPYHPASNGAAENAVKIIKGVIKKAKVSKIDIETAIYRFLLNYHNTPHTTTGECPAKLLQGRLLRTRLDVLRPDNEAIVEQKQTKKVASTGNTETRRLDVGEPVWYRNYNSSQKWLEGRITERLGKNNYNVSSAGGVLQHRHIDQLKTGARRSTCVYPTAEDPDGGAAVVAPVGPVAALGQRRSAGETSEPGELPPVAQGIGEANASGSHAHAENKEQPVDLPEPEEAHSTAVQVEREARRYMARDRKPVKRYGLEFD